MATQSLARWLRSLETLEKNRRKSRQPAIEELETRLTPAANLTNFFPIGVDAQPSWDSFATWKARGVNTAVRVPSGDTVSAWTAATTQAGLYQIRDASSNPASDLNNPMLLAWELGDEPDINNIPPSQIQASYNQLKSIAPNMPVMVNFSGGDVIGIGGGPSSATYQQYMQGADWGSNDVYPVTGWGQPTHIGWVGQAVATLSNLSGGKPQFAYIETSQQFAGPRGSLSQDRAVTPDEFRGEIWDAIIHGARGIIYFPESFVNGFTFDATPANIVQEMTRQDALITGLTNVIQGAVNPSGPSAAVSSPLEVGWRTDGTNNYFFVLNLSANQQNGARINLSGVGSPTSASVYNESRSVSVAGGVITDNFGPYALHIYVVPVASSSNQAPTVAQAASAGANLVTGKTVSLSVLGADDHGAGNLTYTWSSTGPAAVSFSANNTTTASNTTATFSQAGSYKFTATIQDAGGLSVTSSVTVTVNQTLSSITVTPGSASIAVNGSQQFAAVGKDQFGIALATQPAFTWSVASGSGTVSSTGLYKAGATPGSATVKAANGSVSATASVTVTAPTTAYSIWNSSATPATAASSDSAAVELGVKFASSVAGTITGLRFYKGAGNTGTHVGHIWASDGTLLATATFTGESATGWQQVTFSTPLAIQANTVYIASYHTDTGHYAFNDSYFTSAVTNGPLTALASSAAGGNGVYHYGSASGFPNQTYHSANYWVDVVFAPAKTSLRINAGGSAVGSFLADGFFTGGSTNSVTNAINLSGVTNPAPASVYQTWRYGNFSYTIPNLAPGQTYTVRLDFSENIATAAGQRVFNVGINGKQVLSNFDVFATAGGAFRALTETFSATADSSGQIVIQFTTVVGNARVNGIEVFN